MLSGPPRRKSTERERKPEVIVQYCVTKAVDVGRSAPKKQTVRRERAD